MPSPVIRFSGPVRWVAGPGPAGITLLGTISDPGGGSSAAQLSLHGIEPVPLPDTLSDVTFQALAAQDVLLRSGAQQWPLHCRTWQLHLDVGPMFYAAVPPRPTPLSRRLAWRLMLGIVAFGAGRWLLTRISGGG